MRQQLALKPAHKVVQDFYQEIGNLSQLHLFHEGAVSPAFANLLKRCASQFGWTLSEQHQARPHALSAKEKGGNLRFDGALLDEFKLVHGVWEAKDTKDELTVEAAKKFKAGYPRDNFLIQSPERAVLYQNGQLLFDADLRKPEQLVAILELFFEYEPPAYEQWNEAVEEFKLRIHEYGESALAIIQQERRTNKRFVQAFNAFMEVCRAAVNPNLSVQAVEEMLIQHLLTERLFRKVFNNPDFIRRNAIAAEIEKVIDALASQSFSRADFLRKLDRFYGAIEATAETISDFSEKQAFLNVVYEKFFQGFSVKVADTHGIVYTPQPVVDFMVRSVEALLQREFGRSLSDAGVQILDPFTGTGNFIVRVMREIRKSALPGKFAGELHCNEVMLLPYYIASQNLEHAYYELTGQYLPFEGLCLVDTFQLAEGPQMEMSFLTAGNSERVKRQQAAPIFVILGNPPYNAHQLNENDNSKNRKYKVMDARVAETYARDSAATNKNALSDPYVKAYRWASDRIAQTGEGIVAYISNNSFLEELTFDGMRANLEKDFDAIYTLNLTGNVRKNPKLSGTTHNVFGIQVGVNITFLIKHKPDGSAGDGTGRARIYYARTGEDWRKEEKFDFLNAKGDYQAIDWQELTPDARHAWLTDGLQDDFETFISMGIKETKNKTNEGMIFEVYSNGLKTNRDTWVYNFQKLELEQNIQRTIEFYNEHVSRWQRKPSAINIDDFAINDDQKISWSRDLKKDLQRGKYAEFELSKIRHSTYRPFTKQFLFFDRMLNEEIYQIEKLFPLLDSQNQVICVSGVGNRKEFGCLMTNQVASLDFAFEKAQCFPFYVYDEDGSHRRENISDWALEQFRAQYGPHPLAPSPLRGDGEAPLPHKVGKGSGDEVALPHKVGKGPGDEVALEPGEEPKRRAAPYELWLKLKPLTREMRHQPTAAEDRLWQLLRNRQIKNAKFRRQHAIDRFIVDFYCPEFNLVIEADGPIHQYTIEEDGLRQAYLESQGLRVLRFDNEAILEQTGSVIQQISEALGPHPLAPSPLRDDDDETPLPHAVEKGLGDEVALPHKVGKGPGDEVALPEITKWDLFHYVYALLHSPAYREKYAANLKRDLPHIPFVETVETFWKYVEAGRKLAELHVHYEDQPEYPLELVENNSAPLNWRVEKMRLSKDRTEIQYNDFLTLKGLPAETFEYRLGNRSALEWVIDQYRVTTDPRSKIVNDPNDSDDPQYILRLVKKVVTVSLETVQIVNALGAAA
jgi:predicted helicase/very-short-patch-repair endonuclease